MNTIAYEINQLEKELDWLKETNEITKEEKEERINEVEKELEKRLW